MPVLVAALRAKRQESHEATGRRGQADEVVQLPGLTTRAERRQVGSAVVAGEDEGNPQLRQRLPSLLPVIRPEHRARHAARTHPARHQRGPPQLSCGDYGPQRRVQGDARAGAQRRQNDDLDHHRWVERIRYGELVRVDDPSTAHGRELGVESDDDPGAARAHRLHRRELAERGRRHRHDPCDGPRRGRRPAGRRATVTRSKPGAPHRG